MSNQAVRDFFTKEVAAGQDNRLKTDPQLRYRVNGKRRWSLVARQKHVVVWQDGRFTDDESFWKQHLGNEAQVRVVNSGQSLAFNLAKAQQLDTFKTAVMGELLNQGFLE